MYSHAIQTAFQTTVTAILALAGLVVSLLIGLSIGIALMLFLPTDSQAQVFDEDQIPVITNTKLADMTGNTIKLRNNAASGDPEDKKISELTDDPTPTTDDLLLVEDGSTGAIGKTTLANLPAVTHASTTGQTSSDHHVKTTDTNTSLYDNDGTIGTISSTRTATLNSLATFDIDLSSGANVFSVNDNAQLVQLGNDGSLIRFDASGAELTIAAGDDLTINGDTGTLADMITSGGSNNPPEYTTLTGGTDISVTHDGALDTLTVAYTGSPGDVSKVGTPVDNQVAIWTGDGTAQGSDKFKFDPATEIFYIEDTAGSTASFTINVAAANAGMRFFNGTTTPPADTEIARINFKGLNDAASETAYSQIRGCIEDDTAAAELGCVDFYTKQSGTLTKTMRIDGSGNVGIGDTTPDGTLTLDIGGDVGAINYCDDAGNNCSPATSIGRPVMAEFGINNAQGVNATSRTVLDFNVNTLTDTGITHSTTVNPSRITVDAASRCELSGTIGVEGTTTNYRYTGQVDININGGAVQNGTISGYIRVNSGANFAALDAIALFDMAANDYVEIGVTRISTLTGNATTDADKTRVILKCWKD